VWALRETRSIEEAVLAVLDDPREVRSSKICKGPAEFTPEDD
jgi:hypothetical protein